MARVICIVLLLLLPRGVAAQFPPERLQNVKALPSDLPVRAVIDTMRSFTRALGVRCTYCHLGQETDPLERYDFVSDEKPEKRKAREMIRMVTAINDSHLTRLEDRRDPRIIVTCATCHRGITAPRPLQQILTSVYDQSGIDSTIASYRALRARYHGRAAYDFGEVALADVAAALIARGRTGDAVRLNLLNVEFLPGSGFAHRQTAASQLAAGDTAAAIGSLQRALQVNPRDTQAQQALQQLQRRDP